MLPNLGGINPQKMLQKMQADMTRIQDELDAERMETTSGGGAVRVTTSGMGEVLEIKIAPEAVDPSDVEMLEEMITSAVREALQKAQDHHQEKMGQVTGGLNIPGLF